MPWDNASANRHAELRAHICAVLPPLGPLQEWIGSDDRTHAHAGGREMGPKEPNEIDRLVGSRVRQRRMQLGMSQEQLAEQLGITVPQVQKYEKGVNRIGASRLHKIAGLLGVPIGFFFEAHARRTRARRRASLRWAELRPAGPSPVSRTRRCLPIARRSRWRWPSTASRAQSGG